MKKIICIIGESGTGKSLLKDMMCYDFNFHSVKCRSTRQPRYEGENSHNFITKDEYDSYTNKIAYTKFGDNYYCVLESDFKDGVNVYTVDDNGYSQLKEKGYDVISIRIKRDNGLKHGVSQERLKRDSGMFDNIDYDYIINNNYSEPDKLLNDVKQVLKIILKDLL
jgi:guanylate kinase